MSRISDARVTRLAQLVLRTVREEGLGKVRSEHAFLATAKRVLDEELRPDAELDAAVRRRIPPRIPPGSREWDVLYRRLREEELRRRRRRP